LANIETAYASVYRVRTAALVSDLGLVYAPIEFDPLAGAVCEPTGANEVIVLQGAPVAGAIAIVNIQTGVLTRFTPPVCHTQ
jgi:hypothetical protein